MDKFKETAECAYYIWMQAGCPEGKDLDHWLQAEAELAGKAGRQSPTAGSARVNAGASTAEQKKSESKGDAAHHRHAA